jgi:hypothetical protein
MIETIHISTELLKFEDFKKYILYLDAIYRAGYIDNINSITWEENGQVKAKLKLKHPPNFMNLKVTIEEPSGLCQTI